MIKKRKERKIKYFNFPFFKIGDVLFLSYYLKYKMMYFRGICIAKKNKKINNRGSSLTLRILNKQIKSGVELTVSTHTNKVFNIVLNLLGKRKLNYRKAKLYYLKDKLNKYSLV